MNRVWKRIFSLSLCVTLVIGNNAILGFAEEVNESVEIQKDEEALEPIENSFVESSIIDIPEETTQETQEVFDKEIESSAEEMTEETEEESETETTEVEELVLEALDENYSFKYKVNTNGTSATITGIEEKSGNNLDIPENIDGYMVTDIAGLAFEGCIFTGQLTLPNTLKTIGKEAFSGCNFSGSLEIPDVVTSIGPYAFKGCNFTGGLSIGRIYPESESSDSIFSGCKIDGLTIRSGVTNIPKYIFITKSYYYNVGRRYSPFYECEITGSLILPDSVTSIGEWAFNGCDFTGSLTLPNGLTSIGYNAFKDCGFTGSLILPDGITSIGSNAFDGCNFTGSLMIPNSVTSIGSEAFKGCNFTEGLSVGRLYPGSNKSESPFAGCQVNGLTIRNTVTKIDAYAFNNCSGFTGSLMLPDGITSVGGNAFNGCNLTVNSSIIEKLTSIGSYAFCGCDFIGTVILQDDLTSIGSYAFSGCNLTGGLSIGNIYTPSSSYIAAFSRCKINGLIIRNGVKSIPVGAFCTSSYYYDFGEYGKTLHSLFEGCEFTGNLVIPSSVTSIGAYAFAGCNFTGSLNIPSNVTTIEDFTFRDCKFSGDLSLPGKIKRIGACSFDGCKFTGSLTIPNGVTSIGAAAFRGCEFAGSLMLPDSVTAIGYSAFSGCKFSGNLTLPSKITSIEYGTFEECKFTGDMKIPSNVASIGERAFNGCGFTGRLMLPDSVTSIGAYAFSHCKFTGRLTLPDSVNSIGDWAFGECEFTGSLTLPDSVTNIGYSAFANCDFSEGVSIGRIYQGYSSFKECKINGLTIRNGVSNIPDYAFYMNGSYDYNGRKIYSLFYESEITGTLTLPDSVISIGDRAFCGCGFTGSLTIPSSVNHIGIDVLSGCENLICIENSSVEILSLPECSIWKDLTTKKPITSVANGIAVTGEYVDTPKEPNDIDDFVGFWIKLVNNTGSDDGKYYYSGKAIKPDIVVYDGSEKLKLNKDYTYKIKNNVNVGKATVTIEGKGNYDSVDTVEFEILRKNVESDEFVVDEIALKSTARVQTPKPVLKWNGKAVAATNYTLQYFKADAEGNPTGDALANVKDAGKYVIVLTGRGNFEGERNVPLTLTDDTQKLVSSLSVATIKSQTYTGEAIEPAITVKSGKIELTKSEDGVTGDYTVEYRNNIAVGTATVVITGINSYVGTKIVTFKINGTPIKKATVEGITATMSYTGNDIIFDDVKVFIKGTKTTEEIKLIKDTDYKISYLNNQKAGVATVVFTGINGYTGALKKTFRITPAKQADMVDRFEVDFISSSVTTDGIVYSKGGAKPTVAVKFVNGDGSERVLTEKTDYILAYIKNTAVNDCSNDKNLPTVKVTFRGSYNGVITKNFKITAKDISTVTATVADKTYAKKAGAYKSAVKFTDTDGKSLVANRDYNSAVEYSVIRDGEKFVLGTKDIVEAGEIVTATVKAKEGGNYTGTKNCTYRVTKSPITSAKVVKSDSKTYTGKAITLTQDDITVKPSALADELVYGIDYEIVEGSYTNNINKGTASVLIRGIGNYGGIRKVTFTIKAKGFVWWWRK